MLWAYPLEPEETQRSFLESAEATEYRPRPAPARPAARAGPELQSTAPAAPPPESAEADTSITDEVWRRLKTIFQRHQAAESETPAARTTEGEGSDLAVDADEPAAPVPGPSRDRGPEPPEKVLGRPVELRSPREVGPVHKTPFEETPSQNPESEAAPPEAPSSIDELDLRPGTEAAAEERAIDQRPAQRPTVPESPSIVEKTREPTLLRPSPEAESALAAKGRADEAAPEEVEAQPVSRPAEEPDAAFSEPTPTHPAIEHTVASEKESPTEALGVSRPDEAEAGYGEEIAAPGEDVTAPVQPRPLQDVWQVERLPSSESLSSDHLATAPPVSIPPPRRGPGPGLDEVLDRVEAGRPTRSSIEVIPPRRPRPEVASRTPGPVQRKPTEPESAEKPLQPESSDVIRPHVTLDEQQEVPTVATEIGALPADLWELIGEPVPSAREAPPAQAPERAAARPPQAPAVILSPPSTTAGAAPPAREPTVVEAQTRLTETATPAPTVSVTKSPDHRIASADVMSRPRASIVQRAVEMSEVESTVEPPDETEGRDVEEVAGPGVDLEELARRVYSEIKRRFEIERERFRSR
ncbi:MAG: hypothetical protein ACP5HS_00135 [Anaerolineae bacterium]